MMGDVLHVWNWDGRTRPRTSFAYELEGTERIHILVTIGCGVHQDGVIESETWKVIADNLASRAHVTRIMTFHEACATWLACRAVCKEFQQAARWIWFEVCRFFAE